MGASAQETGVDEVTDENFRALCNTYGFAPSRALREMIEVAIAQAAIDERAKQAGHAAALAKPQPLYGWVFKRNADGTVGIFAPPPRPGESQRTSDCVGPNQRDLHELLGKLADHMLADHMAALAEPAQEPVADRAAFEAWLNPGGFAGNVSPWVEPGRYEKNTHQLAWLAWRACERRREAALAEPVQEPPKWKLVRTGPTIGMCIAGDEARQNVDDLTRTPAIYRAMIAAAPAAPQQAEPVQEAVATMTVREDMGADFKFNRPHTLLPGQQFHLHLAPLQRKEGT